MFAGKHTSAPGALRPTLRFLAAAAVLAAALTGCVPYELKQVLDGPEGKPLAISPARTVVPVNGTVNFAAEGGLPPYVFSIASGGGLLDSATGAYTSSSIGTATIRVTDKTGKGADATVAVQAFAGSLTISPAALTLAVGSNVTFSASGGTPPYTFAIQTNNSGSLSAGASGVTSWLYAPGGTPGADMIRLTDSTSAFVTAAVTVTPLSSSVDYSVPATSFLATGTVSTSIPGSPSFTLHNGGSAPGTQTVDYKVYLSANNVLDGGDLLVASGTTGALAAGASFSVPVAGSFPAVPPGPGWNLIVQVSAADDTTTANNTSGAATLTLSPQNIDYTVPAVSHTAGTAAGLAMSGNFTIKNNGTAPGAAGTTWTVYASADTVLDGADYLIASGTHAALGAGITSASIPFAGYWPSTPGTWYLLATVAASDDILPTNNTSASSAVTTTGAAPGNVDYTVATVANAGGAVAGDPLSGNFTVHNGGTDPGAQPVYWTAYLSSNATLELGTDPVIDSGVQAALGAGGTSGTISFNGTWPSVPGTWHLIVALSASDDAAPGNNVTASGLVTTTAPSVDYVVWTIVSTGGTTAGGPLGGTLTIRNTGSHSGSQVVPWAVYLSTDGALNIGTDQLFATGSITAQGLAAGAVSSPINFSGTWPASNVAHTYYLIGTVGAGDDVNPGNDTAPSGSVTVNPPNIDYHVSVVSNAGGTTSSGPAAGNFNIHNNGAAPGASSITWTAYISSNATYEITDQVIATGITGPLGAGGDSGSIGFAGTWPAGIATWYLVVRISAADDINTANDVTASAPFAVTPPAPIYTITAVPLPAGSTVNVPVSGSFTIQNSGGAGSQPVNWQVYASLGNSVYDGGDILLQSGSSGPLGPGGTTSPPYAGTWPSTPGTWFIVVRASCADAGAIVDAASAGVSVVAPPPPNYTVAQNLGEIPWTGVVGTPMDATSFCAFRVYNNSANPGLANVNWYVYLSTDQVLDGGDTLVQQGTIGPVAAHTIAPVSFTGTWPAAPGKVYWLIFKVHATDDSFPADDVVTAAHPSAIGDFRYQEGGENNDDTGGYPTFFSATAATLGPNKILVIEGTMDGYLGYDTYQFATSGARSLNVQALWATGSNDLDLMLWDAGRLNINAFSSDGSADSEPASGTFNSTSGLANATYNVSAYMWFDEGGSGSTGQTYVLIVKALP